MPILKMSEIDLENKYVLIREDLNVPLENGRITNDARIRAAIPTIEYALRNNARVILMSHLGRPTEGQCEEQYSLAPVATRIAELLGQTVKFIPNGLDGVEVPIGEVVLLENVRFNVGEKNNDHTLAKKMAQLCDVFVMDAFATAHRAEASTYGIAEFAPIACAGPLLIAELEALSRAMHQPAHPLVAIVGGAKVSTKLAVLESLINLVDVLIVGGGIANTFIAATGAKVGKSLYEEDFLQKAQELIQIANQCHSQILIPTDVVVAKEFSKEATARMCAIEGIAEDEMILDIGSQTTRHYAELLEKAGTILWNGPVGVFEWEQFAKGTLGIALAVAESNAYSIAGGGDTIAAIEKFNITDKLSYISTGGGAFLEFLEGKKLPAIAALENAARNKFL